MEEAWEKGYLRGLNKLKQRNMTSMKEENYIYKYKRTDTQMI